jgi:hypothetical protein
LNVITKKAAGFASGPSQTKKPKVGYAVSASTLRFTRLFGLLWPLEMTSGTICLTGLNVLVFAGPHAQGLLVIIIDIAADSLEEAVRVDYAIARQQHAFKGKTRPGHSCDDQASRQKSAQFHVLVSSPAVKSAHLVVWVPRIGYRDPTKQYYPTFTRCLPC